MLNINPWGSMWTNPRTTIKAIVSHNPNYRFLLFSTLYGFVEALRGAQIFSLGSYYNFWAIVAACLILCLPIGALSLSLTSLFVFWVGKLIKGQATYREVRAAVTWSNVTVIVSIFLVAATVVLFGPSFFDKNFAYQYFPKGFSILLMGIFFVEFALSLWSFVIFIKALSEVQKFSGWMALLNVVLTAIFLSIVILLIGKFFGLFQISAGS